MMPLVENYKAGKLHHLSQADSSYTEDKYLNNIMDTKAGLIQAEATVTQPDE